MLGHRRATRVVPGALLRPRRLRRAAAALAVGVAGTQIAALALAGPASADFVRDQQAWVLNELNLQSAWAVTQGHGVTVAVIDSGVNGDVSDLAGSVIQGPDMSGVHTKPSNPNWGDHGTWMASLVAGHGHDGGGSGIIGAAPLATVLSIRVITDRTDPNFHRYERESASTSQGELAHAIEYAVNHHAAVISMSLGYSLQTTVVRQALQYAYQHNVMVVASAGNSGDTAGAKGTGQAPYSFPADYPGVLAVGAVNQAGQVSGFSSQNLSVQVAAPGYRVPAQGRNGMYYYVTGTSPACALTAGVVALIKSKYPHLPDWKVISAITTSTSPGSRPSGGYDQQIGFGIVDAAAALTAAGRLAHARPPAPGLQTSAHFGGGTAAIPAAPVGPRGSTALILYGLLGVVCLGLVALSASRLLGGREPVEAASGEGRMAVAGPYGRYGQESAPPAAPPDQNQYPGTS
ncbi:MAG TPA: S8 family serine peptidase [Streptosporangiaceae bacterium]